MAKKLKEHQHFDLEKAYQKACLVIEQSDDELVFKTKFKLWNKSNFGVLSLLFMGLFLMYMITFFSTDDTLFDRIVTVVILLLGLMSTGFSVLTLLKQMTDYVKVSPQGIQFRNSLVTRKFKLSPDLKLKMRTRKEHFQLNAQAGDGSNFMIVEFFLSNGQKEFRVLDFSMNAKNSAMANYVGTAIVRQLKEKMKGCLTAKKSS